MTVVDIGILVADARKRGVALPAFNLITLEHAEAIVAAASQAERGVVLALSENTIRYHGGAAEPILAAAHLVAMRADVPVALHLDHVTDDGLVAEAVRGPLRPYLSSLMFDGGALPYAENVARTKRVVDDGHAFGLWVEAELGYVGGKPGAAQSAHSPGVRTDPDEAAAFVAATGVDALAVAVGSSHAMTTRTARLDHELIAALADRVPVPLVLHGSSGVPDDELRRSVRAGMTKINVGTALNLAMTASVRSGLAADPDLTDPRRYLGPARTAMQDAVLHLLETLE